MLDEHRVGTGGNGHPLLEEPIEQFSSRAGGPSVETESEFVEVVVEMSVTDGPLMRSQEPAFEKSNYAMDPGQQIGATLLSGRDLVGVAGLFQAGISSPAVSVHDATDLDCIMDELPQTGIGSVFDALHPDPPYAGPIFLSGDHDQGSTLPCTAPPRLCRWPPQISLVHFDPTRQPIPSRTNHCTTQFVKPGPRRLIAAKPEDSLQTQSAGPVLLAAYPPHSSKPDAQRGSSVLEDRARGYGGLVTT